MTGKISEDTDVVTLVGGELIPVVSSGTNKITTPLEIKTYVKTDLVKADVGLGSVDNTADAAKAVLTATKLATARTIDGQSFDGSANVTVIAPGTHAATSKTTPVDADELALVDSAASNVLKKLAWSDLKTTLGLGASSAVTLTWGADTTPPAIGNGTLAARAVQFGPFIWVGFRLSVGSTTSFGTGPIYFQLPSPLNTNAVAYCAGPLMGLDSGTAFRSGACFMNSGENKIRFASEGGANSWGATIPQTWATGDYLTGSLMIPIA